MAINKNALLRYQTLDNCFSNLGRKFYLADLLESCNRALSAYNPESQGIQRRQIFDDIKFMESSQGWSIPLERIKDGKKVYYRYSDVSFSINRQPIKPLEAEQIKAALLVFQRVKGMPQFKWMHALILKLEKEFQLQTTERECIGFDQNEYLKGLEHIGPLFNAILYKRVLRVRYQSFKHSEPVEWVLHPHYLKQFNNRWFLLGQNPDFETLSNLALDRIVSFEEIDRPYEASTVDFDEYFEDILGVTVPVESAPVLIRLHAAPELAPYIQTKPLHGSQKQLSEDAQGTVFSIEVMPNYELEKKILSFGADLCVLDPPFFREKLKNRVLEMGRRYECMSTA